MLIKAGNSVVQTSDTKRRGGRWDPGRLTKETLIPKELGDIIEREVEVLANKGSPSLSDIKLGISKALEKWEERGVNKSGG